LATSKGSANANKSFTGLPFVILRTTKLLPSKDTLITIISDKMLQFNAYMSFSRGVNAEFSYSFLANLALFRLQQQAV